MTTKHLLDGKCNAVELVGYTVPYCHGFIRSRFSTRINSGHCVVSHNTWRCLPNEVAIMSKVSVSTADHG